MSAVESLTNIAVGYGVSVATAQVVLPLMGIPITIAQNLWIGGMFTAVSIVRSYALRRLFEHVRVGYHLGR